MTENSAGEEHLFERITAGLDVKITTRVPDVTGSCESLFMSPGAAARCRRSLTAAGIDPRDVYTYEDEDGGVRVVFDLDGHTPDMVHVFSRACHEAIAAWFGEFTEWGALPRHEHRGRRRGPAAQDSSRLRRSGSAEQGAEARMFRQRAGVLLEFADTLYTTPNGDLYLSNGVIVAEWNGDTTTATNLTRLSDDVVAALVAGTFTMHGNPLRLTRDEAEDLKARYFAETTRLGGVALGLPPLPEEVEQVEEPLAEWERELLFGRSGVAICGSMGGPSDAAAKSEAPSPEARSAEEGTHNTDEQAFMEMNAGLLADYDTWTITEHPPTWDAWTPDNPNTPQKKRYRARATHTDGTTESKEKGPDALDTLLALHEDGYITAYNIRNFDLDAVLCFLDNGGIIEFVFNDGGDIPPLLWEAYTLRERERGEE